MVPRKYRISRGIEQPAYLGNGGGTVTMNTDGVFYELEVPQWNAFVVIDSSIMEIISIDS
jgi:hypothetical protein